MRKEPIKIDRFFIYFNPNPSIMRFSSFHSSTSSCNSISPEGVIEKYFLGGPSVLFSTTDFKAPPCSSLRNIA